MARVRNVSDEVVGALKRGTAAHGRFAEAERRNILQAALAEEGFAARSEALRQRSDISGEDMATAVDALKGPPPLHAPASPRRTIGGVIASK